MTNQEILHHRLINQQIVASKFKKPQDIVTWMVAMQAQEYAYAKWAIGLRLAGNTEAKVEKAFNQGKILRTHIMRPTWHFVSPADIRWMLMLTAPRVHAASAFMYRKSGLTAQICNRSNDVLAKALEGGKFLNRAEMRATLEKEKINTEEFRFIYLLMHAELEGIICSGPRQGKQFTYALLDERVPPAKAYTREEALYELTRRYFTSRGPASVYDFAYWSGLTIREAKQGVASLPDTFERRNHAEKPGDKQEHIFIPRDNIKITGGKSTFLMPIYDEYGMSYKNRNALSGMLGKPGPDTIFNYLLIINGRIEGTWIRALKKDSVSVETFPFSTLNKASKQAVAAAVKRFHDFMGKTVE